MKIKDRKKRLNIILKLIILFILVLSCFKAKAILKSKKEEEIIKNNYITLQNLEKVDVADIEKKISEKQNYSDDVNEENLIKTSVKSNKVYFEDTLFMGDSLTEPLDFYNILSKSSVLAKKGQDVIKAKKEVDTLANIKPKRVFLLYGVNDLDLFTNAEDFKANYIKLIQEIKQKVPDIEIYIQSLTPVQAKVQKKRKNYSQYRIDNFLEKVKEVAKEENVNYIDIRSVVKDRDDLYEPDGIHFNINFYDLWLEYLKNQLQNISRRGGEI